jgi:hypothetical protein
MPYWADDDAARAEEALRGLGFADVQQPDGAHACTIRMDIGGKSDAEIFSGGSKANLRRRMGQADKAGASVRLGTSGDWTHLRELYAAMMKAQGRGSRPAVWWSALERYLADERRGALFACEHEGRVVTACAILRHGARATFAWGASVPDDLPFAKSVPALVAAIRWARDAGCSSFDLGGVPLEDDPDPKRNAIARFKYDFEKRRVRLVREHASWLVGRRC